MRNTVIDLSLVSTCSTSKGKVMHQQVPGPCNTNFVVEGQSEGSICDKAPWALHWFWWFGTSPPLASSLQCSRVRYVVIVNNVKSKDSEVVRLVGPGIRMIELHRARRGEMGDRRGRGRWGLHKEACFLNKISSGRSTIPCC